MAIIQEKKDRGEDRLFFKFTFMYDISPEKWINCSGNATESQKIFQK
jgi:hypothetical protein